MPYLRKFSDLRRGLFETLRTDATEVNVASSQIIEIFVVIEGIGTEESLIFADPFLGRSFFNEPEHYSAISISR